MIGMLLGLPRWAYWLAGGAALVLGAMLWLHFHDKAVRNADRARAAAEAAETARGADAAAQAEIEASRNEVEVSNDEARKAAADSDDPLAAAMRRLRERQGGSGPPSR